MKNKSWYVQAERRRSKAEGIALAIDLINRKPIAEVVTQLNLKYENLMTEYDQLLKENKKNG